MKKGRLFAAIRHASSRQQLGRCARRFRLSSYFSSMSVENLTEPSLKISTRGVVPRMPIVPIGVLTLMLPVWATSPVVGI
jgi:hypothetical protein